MEAKEIPLEMVSEQAEHAHHSGDHGEPHKHAVGWITWAALLSAVLAVLAAVTAMYSSGDLDDAMMNQMKASDQWGYYQAKSIKATVMETRLSILESLGKGRNPAGVSKIQEYANEQKEIKEKAEHYQKESEERFERSAIFSRGVTLFQIAIAVTAIAVLSKRRRFLFISGAFGLIAVFYLIQGILFPIG